MIFFPCLTSDGSASSLTFLITKKLINLKYLRHILIGNLVDIHSTNHKYA